MAVAMETMLDLEALLVKYKQGSRKGYDEFVTLFTRVDTSDELLLKSLISVKESVTQLGPEHEHLVGAILRLKWVCRGPEICETYKAFICCLVSVHTDYLRAVLRMIIKQLRPAVDGDVEEEKLNSDKQIFQSLHSLLQKIVQIVPMSPKVIMPLLIDLFPFMNKHVYIQESYVQNLFIITQYIPYLRQQILELVIDKFLKIDNRLIETILMSTHNIGFGREIMDLEYHHSLLPGALLMHLFPEIFQDLSMNEVQLPKDEILRQQSEDHEESGVFDMEEVTPKVAEVDTLDTLMVRLFQYLENSCFDEGGLNWEATKRLYRELLYIFEKIVLTTHASNHVQFVLFYLCSLKSEICDGFIDFLWKLVQNPNFQGFFRQAAVAYLGSLLARGTFVSIQTVKKTLEIMVSWLHSYVQMSSDTVMADVTHHGPFYCVCQTVFYVFSFRQKELLNSKKGLKWAETLQLQHLVQSRLNPLKVCLPIIVKTFASIVRQHQLVFCDHIIQQNKRSLSLMVGRGYQVLDAHFPFDPYLLDKSSLYIKSNYRTYDKSLLVEESDSSDDDDDDIITSETMATSHTDSGAITPNSLAERSMLDIMGYGTSPGFSQMKYET